LEVTLSSERGKALLLGGGLIPRDYSDPLHEPSVAGQAEAGSSRPE